MISNKGTTSALILAAVLVLAPMSAAKADNDIGCGVGTMVLEGKQGAIYKLAASWLNGVTMQSISITFGLVNCGSLNDTITASARTRHFAANSFDNLARDMALGEGESLDTLAALLDVPEANRPAFARFAQSHYDSLFPNGQVTSDEMLETLDRLMQEEARYSVFLPLATQRG